MHPTSSSSTPSPDPDFPVAQKNNLAFHPDAMRRRDALAQG